jgi:hypothetical protein
MNLKRGFVLMSFLLVFATGSMAQDSLLGKKKGGSSSGGSSSPPQSSSSGSKKQDKKSDSEREDQSRVEQRQSTNPRKATPVSEQRPKYQPRSGRINYGTSNNLLNKQGTKRTPVRIDSAPSMRSLNDDVTSMRDQIRREDRSRVRERDRDGRDSRDWDRDRDDFRWGRFRVGYYQYDRGFRDDYFCYPHYVFNPYTANNCMISPWYYYSYLPPYISYTRVLVSTAYVGQFNGFRYDYIPPTRNRSDYDARGGGYDGNYLTRRTLDYAVDDIVAAFMDQNRRAIDRLTPRNGQVTLAVDGSVSYGVRSDDFYDMLMDVATNSHTVGYEIISVKNNLDEAEVIARHDYLDSWGERQSVYHKYLLYGERGYGVVIRYFETSSEIFFY